MKKAMLVSVSFMTRVIVDDNATKEETVEKARDMFVLKARTELFDNLEEVVEDTEQPFDPKFDKE